MKKIVVFSTIGLIVANLIAGLIISYYHPFNVATSSMAILLTGCLNYFVATITLKDAFRVAHHYLSISLGIVMFLLMIFSPHQLKDNWCIAVALMLFVVEVIMIYVAHRITVQ